MRGRMLKAVQVGKKAERMVKEIKYRRVYNIVSRTARRSNQSILKEISPEFSLEGLMLKLKLQYFGHLIQRAGSFEKLTVHLIINIKGKSIINKRQLHLRW